MASFRKYATILALGLTFLVVSAAPVQASDRCGALKQLVNRVRGAVDQGNFTDVADALLTFRRSSNSSVEVGDIVWVERTGGYRSLGRVKSTQGDQAMVSVMKNGDVPSDLHGGTWDAWKPVDLKSIQKATPTEIEQASSARRMAHIATHKATDVNPGDLVWIDRTGGNRSVGEVVGMSSDGNARVLIMMDGSVPSDFTSPAWNGQKVVSASSLKKVTSEEQASFRRVQTHAVRQPDPPQARSAAAVAQANDVLDGSKALRLLEREGLLPQHSFRARNAEFQFGEFFTDGTGRVFVVGTVKADGKTTYRVFYRSKSQASFRLLPAVNNGIYGHPGYDKALGEEFLALPSEAQEFLAGRLATAPPVNRLPEIPAEELEGIVPVNRTLEQHSNYRRSPDYLGQHLDQGETLLQRRRPGDPFIRDHHGREFLEPHNVTIRVPGKRPNYAAPLREFQLDTSLSGRVTARVYPSMDGSLEYTLLQDSSGRVWFADIGSRVSDLTPHGVRRVPVNAEELLTPRWEYHEQIPGGSVGGYNPVDSRYGDAWDYLHEIPEIRRWYREMRIPMPDAEVLPAAAGMR